MVQAEAEPGAGIFDALASASPYPMFAMLRDNAPVMRIGAGRALGRRPLRRRPARAARPETFSSEVSAEVLAGEAARRSMIFNDPPVHTRLRGLLAKAFTPRTVELQREYVQENCDELVAQLCSTSRSRRHRRARVSAAGHGHREHARRWRTATWRRSSAGPTRSSRTSAPA